MASKEQWWVIESAGQRTGIQKLGYVEATSKQQALDTLPGSTFVGGPYPTEAAAHKAHPGTKGPHGTDPGTGQPPGSISDAPDIPTIPNPLGWLEEIAHFQAILITALTDIHMWISLAWLWLGLTLLILGVLFWLKIPQAIAKHAPEIAAAAAA